MRSKNKMVLIEGRNMVHDALESKVKVQSLYIAESARSDQKVKEIERLAKSKKVEILVLNNEELIKMAQTKNPQGVLAMMEVDENLTLEKILRDDRNAFILLLNHIDYEQNLGAILRSAWASGVDAIVVSPNGVHELTPVVAKVSMGGAAHVPLFGMSLYQAIKLIHEYAVPLVGVEVGMGKSIYETNLRGPIAFLMGGEEVGISESLIKECDLMMHIPMAGKIASLNVSVASAVAMFEKLRQENAPTSRG